MDHRIEKDTLGEVKVPLNTYWGAQTERSRSNFKIGPMASMPIEIIYGFAYLKKAAAYTNYDAGVLDQNKRDLIASVCDEILKGELDEIKEAMSDSGAKGMQTFDMSLYNLYQENRITLEEALNNADSRTNLEAKINFG